MYSGERMAIKVELVEDIRAAQCVFIFYICDCFGMEGRGGPT